VHLKGDSHLEGHNKNNWQGAQLLYVAFIHIIGGRWN
jgi:hypothetical protein